jgi:hypothetical protein
MRATYGLIIGSLVLAVTLQGRAQAPQGAAGGRLAPVRKSEVGERLAPADQSYASIDGAQLMQYLKEQTAMSRRYRDKGHQFWGRITGTEVDAENSEWLMAQFKRIGLSDVKEQPFDLQPQWMPASWSVKATGAGKSVDVATAQPTYLGVGTPATGLDLDVVWAGLGSDADLAMAPDVKGKAVFFYSTDLASRHQPISDNAIARISQRGAAAIFVVLGIPGNLRTQFYPVNAPVPTFSVGQRDGLAVRDLVAAAKGTARVAVKLDVQRVPNLKSRMVWATLPGATDETLIVVAHRDGWFEGANDNASGVATALGIAEYFAKVPQAQRRRTIIFLGTTGHHDNGAESGAWLTAHPEVFAKTAVLLNAEHTGAVGTSHTSPQNSNAAGPLTWFAGSDRLAPIAIDALDSFGVATYPQMSASPAGEIGRYYRLAPAIQFMSSGFVWHSDQESDSTISAEGLAAVTRAYAKIMAETGKVDLAALRGTR